MANKFNNKVALGLKIWKGGKYILHMIDMFSRLSVSVFIERKHPREIVDKIMWYWVAAGWGVMKSVLFDNGGEFSNHEIREVASILNVETCTTPSESPWSNGLCERNHQITDRMLEILEDENPNTDFDTLLCRYQFDQFPSPPGHPGAFVLKCVPSPRAFAQQKMPGGRANK